MLGFTVNPKGPVVQLKISDIKIDIKSNFAFNFPLEPVDQWTISLLVNHLHHHADVCDCSDVCLSKKGFPIGASGPSYPILEASGLRG